MVIAPGWWKRWPTVAAPRWRCRRSRTATTSSPSKRDDALQRADPAQALGRGRGGAPAHRLGPGEGADDGGDRLGEHVGGRAAGLVDHREPDAVALVQLVLGQAGLAQEAFERLRRRARCAGPWSPRAPLRSRAGRPRAISASRRGVDIGLDRLGRQAGLAELAPRTAARDRPRALACIRAGISSERSSRRKSAMKRPSPCPLRKREREDSHRRLRSRCGKVGMRLSPHAAHPFFSIHASQRPSPGRGRGRYRPGARRPRSRRAPAAG